MSKRKEEEFAPQGEKQSWHKYSLQELSPSKFNQVVGKIMQGNYSLILTEGKKDKF